MNTTRRAALALALAAAAVPARAQGFPSRPIRFISPGAPGSVSDSIPRFLAPELAELLRQRVIVENRTGGSGLIGTQAAIAAPADGHAILISTLGSMAINAAIMPRMPLDITRDVRGLALLASTPLVLVVKPDAPYQDVASLVADAKARPGTLSYGHVGAGSTPSLTAAMLTRASGTEMIPVPYNGYPAALTEIVAGRLTFMFSDTTALPQVRGGALQALAVTGAARSPLWPEVPTLLELGHDVDVTLWFGLYARAGVPDEARTRLTEAARTAVSRPAYREGLARLGLEPGTLFGDDFHRFHLDEARRWAALIPSLGVQIPP